ncbi:MAG TPA: AAA family ATPase [Bryobacteraceae bacterium]|nr:AAA family ATPase [Bryobacteraceae bacterium]
MITHVAAKNYRCLLYVEQPLAPFQILIGSNASGKTTFLDTISFVGDLCSGGLEVAFSNRTQNPLDLMWGRRPGTIVLELEARIPDDVAGRWLRYRVAIDVHPEPAIVRERAFFVEPGSSASARLLAESTNLLFDRMENGDVTYYPAASGHQLSYRLGKEKSALAALPPDEYQFAAGLQLKELMERGVQRMEINGEALRLASPPVKTNVFRSDGSNLPWKVQQLKEKQPDSFHHWLRHIRMALPDIADLDVIVREDDRHAYLMISYKSGLRAPSWVVSDGTLRLLALTILAYLPAHSDIYLIEEPENGIHPTAIELIHQSLTSVYDGQVLMASHSPVLLTVAEPEQLLCFSRNAEGATQIVRGDQHRILKEWRREVSLGTMFASGILGD